MYARCVGGKNHGITVSEKAAVAPPRRGYVRGSRLLSRLPIQDDLQRRLAPFGVSLTRRDNERRALVEVWSPSLVEFGDRFDDERRGASVPVISGVSRPIVAEVTYAEKPLFRIKSPLRLVAAGIDTFFFYSTRDSHFWNVHAWQIEVVARVPELAKSWGLTVTRCSRAFIMIGFKRETTRWRLEERIRPVRPPTTEQLPVCDATDQLALFGTMRSAARADLAPSGIGRARGTHGGGQ